MKIFLFLLAISLIANSRAYDDSECVFYRHMKPVDGLNFLVCTIGVSLPQHIPIVQRIGNEPIKGLLIGQSSQVADDSLFGTFSGVTYYGLLQHNVEHITKESMDYLTHLEGFDVSNGKLAKIDYDSFQDIVYLRDLDLSKNKLDYLHPQIFSTLLALEKINLSGNQLVAVEADMFGSNKKLSLINLRDNKISFIAPRSFEFNNELRELYLNGNVCIDVDYKQPRTQSLRYIFLQQCKETAEVIDMLSDKRNEAESIDYEDEKAQDEEQ
ncbi:leucine-rich repeat transmembrane neuronal protein 2-like [Chironomus tepperi]|uniref:leucine-rich repeat transmembrane neuronal protein 2-like n=1 Tax=Chironomus tepperi TaxID=113505 RepID=UPI00391F6D5C